MWSKMKGNKFGNKTSSLCTQGHSHASKLESSVCQILSLRVKAKEIETIESQVHVKVCGPPEHECLYKEKVELVVDFKLIRPDGSVFYAEAKGFETTDYRIKRRLWMHNKIGRLEIWMGSHLNPKLIETLGE